MLMRHDLVHVIRLVSQSPVWIKPSTMAAKGAWTAVAPSGSRRPLNAAVWRPPGSLRRWLSIPGSRFAFAAAGPARVSANEAASARTPPPGDTVDLPKLDLPKNFDVAGTEERLYKWWEESGFFKPDPNAKGEPFVISMPPPNVTGALHMGHAMFATLQDIMARTARMQGRPTLWLPGTDHAGIATQLVVERMLATEGTTRAALGREAFVARVWAWKARYGDTITGQLRRLGASCDWSRERFTLDPALSASVVEAFSRLHAKGLVYRGARMVNWSPNLQTAVSDLEVEYSDEEATLHHFKYPVAGGGHLPVATTRPETILGDTAVAVHPKDSRYAALIGQRCEVPLSGGRTVPIIADEAVDPEFGTGALKVTPGHDVNDYAIAMRQGLPSINIMNKDGTLNAAAGAYSGLDRFEARRRIWADLGAAGLALSTEKRTARVPRSQRGGEVIEPLLSKQWFVRMAPLAAPALAAVADGRVAILPDRFAKVYNHWLENITDWCVSRQLWWGHRLPVYYIFASAASASDAQGRGEGEDYVVAASEAEALDQARTRLGPGAVVVQDPDVLDTWFSSALWPFSTLGWPDQGGDFAQFYPTSVMETGHDILFFWVARMLMLGLEFTGVPPFHTVFLHGLVRDEAGRKMSKSLGNVVDPLDTIAAYGTDALRWALATGTTPGQDLNLSLDKVAAARNLTNKLWNAGKFLLADVNKLTAADRQALASAADSFAGPDALDGLPLPERWVISRLHQAVARATTCHAAYDYGEAGRATSDFFWADFADWYLEASKTRLYATGVGSERAAGDARRVLAYAYDTVLRLMHPAMPYVTEELWQALPHRGISLMLAPWPEGGRAIDLSAVAAFEALQALVRAVRNARAEYNVEPGRRIPAVVVAASPELRGALADERAFLQALCRLDADLLQIVESAPPAAAGEESITLVVRDGLQVLLPLAGLADPAKELARLAKQAAKIEKDLAGCQSRLTSPKFVEQAPADIVAKLRTQAADLAEQLIAVEAKTVQMQRLKDRDAKLELQI